MKLSYGYSREKNDQKYTLLYLIFLSFFALQASVAEMLEQIRRSFVGCNDAGTKFPSFALGTSENQYLGFTDIRSLAHAEEVMRKGV